MLRALRSSLSPSLFVTVFTTITFAFLIASVSIPAHAAATNPASPQAGAVHQTAVVDPMQLRNNTPQSTAVAAADSRAIALAAATGVLTNFMGLDEVDSCAQSDISPPSICEPPFTALAAGPNHVFEFANVAGRIFDKSGKVLQTFDAHDFFGVDPSFVVTDSPRIVYDTMSGRWFASITSLNTGDFATATNGQFNVAVSTTSDPTQPFKIYTFTTTGTYPDLATLGFNDDKVTTTARANSCSPNCDSGISPGAEFVVWNKSDLVAGAATVHTDFFAPPQSDTGVPMPAKSRSSTTTLFMATTQGTSNIERVWSLTGVPGVDGGTTKTTQDVSINNLLIPPSAVQKGSANPIDTGDAIFVKDAVFRDGKFWTSENSACTPAGDSTQRSCLRYIEVLTAGITKNQDFDFGTNGAYDYYPSVDLDSSDNLMTTFSQSSSNEFPSAFIDGREDTDPINTLGTPILIQGGTTSYTGSSWGGSAAGIDPGNETVIWLAAEYATTNGTPNWGTWIASASLAAAAGSGQIQIAPHKLEFGAVKINATKTRHFKIKNTGTGDLNVTVGTLVAPFSVSGGGSFDIPPGGSQTVTITFQPTAKGKVSQTLTVTSDDPNNPSVSIDVSGSGKK